jgi:hypothetical protein
VKGYLDGLSDKDFADFIADKSYAERQIIEAGTGLQNVAAVTFTPTSFALKMSPKFHQTLTTFNQRPSRKSVHNELIGVKSSRDAGLVFQVADVIESKHHEELILNTCCFWSYR